METVPGLPRQMQRRWKERKLVALALVLLASGPLLGVGTSASHRMPTLAPPGIWFPGARSDSANAIADGNYLGIEPETNLSPDEDKNAKWFHECVIVVSGNVVSLEKSPYWFSKGKLWSSASDGGYFTYRGVAGERNGKSVFALKWVSSDYVILSNRGIPQGVFGETFSTPDGFQFDGVEYHRATQITWAELVQQYLASFVSATKLEGDWICAASDATGISAWDSASLKAMIGSRMTVRDGFVSCDIVNKNDYVTPGVTRKVRCHIIDPGLLMPTQINSMFDPREKGTLDPKTFNVSDHVRVFRTDADDQIVSDRGAAKVILNWEGGYFLYVKSRGHP